MRGILGIIADWLFKDNQEMARSKKIMLSRYWLYLVVFLFGLIVYLSIQLLYPNVVYGRSLELVGNVKHKTTAAITFLNNLKDNSNGIAGFVEDGVPVYTPPLDFENEKVKATDVPKDLKSNSENILELLNNPVQNYLPLQENTFVFDADNLKDRLDREGMWYVQGTVNCKGSMVSDLADSMGKVWRINLEGFFPESTDKDVCSNLQWVRLSVKQLGNGVLHKTSGMYIDTVGYPTTPPVIDEKYPVISFSDTHMWLKLHYEGVVVLESDVNLYTCIDGKLLFRVVTSPSNDKVWVDFSEAPDVFSNVCNELVWVRLSAGQVTKEDSVYGEFPNKVWYTFRIR